MNRKRIFFILYFIVFAVCAIEPYSWSVWFAENLPIVILIGVVAWVARKFEFSTTSYLCMFILPLLHTIGGHYTFERVPFDFVTDLFGFERNHYDRIAHFSVGLYAYPLVEYMLAKQVTNTRLAASLFSVCIIFTVASGYEILEWWYAMLADPEAGIAVLGSQGDIWDAQKDMLADGLGAIFAVTIAYLFNKGSQATRVD